jgi:hypothetical protein
MLPSPIQALWSSFCGLLLFLKFFVSSEITTCIINIVYMGCHCCMDRYNCLVRAGPSCFWIL